MNEEASYNEPYFIKLVISSNLPFNSNYHGNITE